MKKIYVGYKKGENSVKLELIRCTSEPTQKEYGKQYFATIGPFKTVRGANFMVKYGWNNPHIQTVSDAERLAKNEQLKAA